MCILPKGSLRPGGGENCCVSSNFHLNGNCLLLIRLGEYNDVSGINSFLTSGVVVKCSHVMSNVKCCVTTGN